MDVAKAFLKLLQERSSVRTVGLRRSTPDIVVYRMDAGDGHGTVVDHATTERELRQARSLDAMADVVVATLHRKLDAALQLARGDECRN